MEREPRTITITDDEALAILDLAQHPSLKFTIWAESLPIRWVWQPEAIDQ